MRSCYERCRAIIGPSINDVGAIIGRLLTMYGRSLAAHFKIENKQENHPSVGIADSSPLWEPLDWLLFKSLSLRIGGPLAVEWW